MLVLVLGLLVVTAVVAVFVLTPGTSEPIVDQGGNAPIVDQNTPQEATPTIERGERQAATTPQDGDGRTLVNSSGDGRPTGAAILGSVITESGDPVPNATVRLTENILAQNPFAQVDVDAGARYSATTDANGRYRFNRLPVNVEFAMWVTHQEHAPRDGVAVRSIADEEQEIAPIVLDSGYRLEGVVLDEASNPLQGVEVTVRMSQVFNMQRTDAQIQEEEDLGRMRTMTTDGNGEFQFDFLAEGIYELQATLEDFGTGVENAITCMGEEKVQRREITLGTEHRLAGTIRDEQGNPVAGATIAAARTRPRPIYQDVVQSDENGAFMIRGLPQGAYGVSVIAEGYASARMSHVQSNREDLEFVMRRKAGVSGRVTQGTGTPVTDFSLELFRVNQGTAQFGVTNRTVNVSNPNGEYTFPDLDRGSYVVLVRADGLSPTYSPGFYVERDLVTDVNIEMQTGGTLRGRILTPDNKPLPGALVTLRGRDFNVWHQHSIFGGAIGDPNNVPITTARTNSKGEFELVDAYPGDHQVEVTHANFLTTYVGVYVQADRVTDAGEVVMALGSSIHGVVNLAGGGIATGASVYLTLKDENAGFFNKKIIADARGRFSFDGLHPGTYEVSAVQEDANAFFFPGASPGSSQDVLIQGEGEKREITLVVPQKD